MNSSVKIVGTIDEIEIEFLLDQVNRFIEDLYQNMSNGFHARAGGDIDSEMALAFFRSKERMDNLKMLLQYMVYFVKAPPTGIMPGSDQVRSYDQFKNFVHTHVNLLLEDDVKGAIMREYVRILPLAEHSLENFEKKISTHYRRMCGLLDGAPSPSEENLFRLFDLLNQFSRYWFDLKENQYRRIRRSDFFIYKFSRLLMENRLS